MVNMRKNFQVIKGDLKSDLKIWKPLPYIHAYRSNINMFCVHKLMLQDQY